MPPVGTIARDQESWAAAKVRPTEDAYREDLDGRTDAFLLAELLHPAAPPHRLAPPLGEHALSRASLPTDAAAARGAHGNSSAYQVVASTAISNWQPTPFETIYSPLPSSLSAYTDGEESPPPSSRARLSRLPWLRASAAKASLPSSLSAYVLLVALYFLQGIPLGLVLGTMPYLLKSKLGVGLSYTNMGIFSMAGFPFSLKVLWSPIVDSRFSRAFGRRKSWIIPTQLLIGISFILISAYVNDWIDQVNSKMALITFVFALLVSLCATQDIAVDGWALTLLDADKVHYSSTCQIIGLNSGFFVSFTVFLGLNSTTFCNQYLRSLPADYPLLDLASFMRGWGIFSLCATIAIAAFKKEEPFTPSWAPTSIASAYGTIATILALPNVRQLSMVLLLARIGFVGLDSIAPLKLLEKGFPQADLALTVLIDFPVQITFGFLAARWTQRLRPLLAWQMAIIFKLCIASTAMIVLFLFPRDGIVTNTYFALVILMTMVSSLSTTIMFVSMSAFFSRISDPVVGGTYITLLNTMANVGGQWPKFAIMSSVDWFTKHACMLPRTGEDVQSTLSAASASLGAIKGSCTGEAARDACIQAGGKCIVERDGFYVVNTVSVVIGLVIVTAVIIPRIRLLEMVPPRKWRIVPASAHGLRHHGREGAMHSPPSRTTVFSVGV